MAEEMKKCFVITPIGDSNSEIRRHIDGIIDQAIVPAIGDKYNIDVAHRKYEIGSINDRVIKSIFESDLVIANLTNLNPNVMFELAIRYSFGKPAIVIAEKGTKLPFDIVDENTVFYINDPAGAEELKNSIIEFENGIDTSKQEYGPVYQTIQKIPLYKEVESGEKVSSEALLSYVIDRLDSLEKSIGNSKENIALRRELLSIIVSKTNAHIIADEKFREELENTLSAYRFILEKVVYRPEDIRIHVGGQDIDEHVRDLMGDLNYTMAQYMKDGYQVRRRVLTK